MRALYFVSFSILLILIAPLSAPLNAQNNVELVVPIAHAGNSNVLSADFSPDGKWIVTASTDKTSKIWEAHSGKLIHTLQGHNKDVNKAFFNPDGLQIITESEDNTVKVWDRKSGKLLGTIQGSEFNHYESIKSILSPDGKRLLTKDNGLVRLWDFYKLSEPLLIFEDASSAIFDETGQYAFISIDSIVQIWDVKKLSKVQGKTFDNLIVFWNSLNERNRIYSRYTKSSKSRKWHVSNDRSDSTKVWNSDGSEIMVIKGEFLNFSFDDKFLIVADNNFGEQKWTTSIWDIDTGQLRSSHEHESVVGAACFNKQSTQVFIGLSLNPKGSGEVIDLLASRTISKFTGYSNGLRSAALNPVNNEILTTFNCCGEPAKLLDLSTGNYIRNIEVFYGDPEVVEFNSRGNLILNVFDIDHRSTDNGFGGTMGGANMIDVESSKVKTAFNNHGHIKVAKFSTKGSWVGTTQFSDREYPEEEIKRELDLRIMDGNSVYVWDINNKRPFPKQFPHPNSLQITSFNFSHDEKKLITADEQGGVQIWDIETEKLVKSFEVHYYSKINSISFSRDDKSFLSSAVDGTIKIIDINSVATLNSFETGNKSIQFAEFSYDEKKLIISTENITSLINISSGKAQSEFKGRFFSFSNDGKWILTKSNACINLHNLENENLQLSFTPLEGINNWVITHPSGLFDASPDALDKLYFVQGLDIIEFGQLKERYYEPGLWKKVMTGEKLRDVVGMKSIDLPPDIEVSPVDKGYLPIKLINRGGGIGQVNIYINGKEVIQDAREKKTDPKSNVVQLKVYIGTHKNIIKGTENYIAVKAWNADHWVVSRGKLITYDSKEIETYKPAIHILSCGVSDYTGTDIDLKYAAKDAEDVSKAIELGAKQLFGIEKSYVYTLTTDRAKEFYPTKATILKTLDRISSTAHPLDVFVMYISGHGINYGGAEGDWHYLTQDAYSANGSAYNDPAIRNQTTISSNELVELFKKVPALKQVLMIDACASGKVVENLMTQKDINSNTLRALDRMRDRTGMHIITGCTADAVSYEASKYGQGVLTYSILEGIRGAALREEQYIDINKLFQYAQDRVPVLAEGIGGIQSPQVFSPQGSQSFDIGLLTDAEKKEIPIAKIRPVYIRSNFQDETELEDVLGLGKIIDEALNEVSSKGSESKLIFVDVKEYPEGCKLIGRYQKVGQTISLKLKKKCGDQVTNHDLKAENMDQLKIEILKLL